jgi:hypothetical protein
MDIGKLGLIVGGLALLLAIPLAVVANMLTPRVQDWYSTTSLKRTHNRLRELRLRLELSEATWKFSPGEWEIYRANFRNKQSSAFALLTVCSFLTARQRR